MVQFRAVSRARHISRNVETLVSSRAKKILISYLSLELSVIYIFFFIYATYLNVFLFILFSIYKISFDVSYIYASFHAFFFLLSVNKRNKGATVCQVFLDI